MAQCILPVTISISQRFKSSNVGRQDITMYSQVAQEISLLIETTFDNRRPPTQQEYSIRKFNLSFRLPPKGSFQDLADLDLGVNFTKSGFFTNAKNAF